MNQPIEQLSGPQMLQVVAGIPAETPPLPNGKLHASYSYFDANPDGSNAQPVRVGGVTFDVGTTPTATNIGEPIQGGLVRTFLFLVIRNDGPVFVYVTVQIDLGSPLEPALLVDQTMNAPTTLTWTSDGWQDGQFIS